MRANIFEDEMLIRSNNNAINVKSGTQKLNSIYDSKLL